MQLRGSGALSDGGRSNEGERGDGSRTNNGEWRQIATMMAQGCGEGERLRAGGWSVGPSEAVSICERK
ncbi:hypothetical protein TorRG33x02_027060 [Trema orientale]|uniref:Uncharacterized protein n=1 Tax=Trema orientale TaxID=63057 RepID=A0A2P5FUF6_TREOI|nr:hypothetical protein TorRG33x02_027060 [Trema orientale]